MEGCWHQAEDRAEGEGAVGRQAGTGQSSERKGWETRRGERGLVSSFFFPDAGLLQILMKTLIFYQY